MTKKRLTDVELMALPFGSIIEEIWSKEVQNHDNEKYRGVVFGNKIGYEDGKINDLNRIAEYVFLGLCTVYLEVNENDQKV